MEQPTDELSTGADFAGVDIVREDEDESSTEEDPSASPSSPNKTSRSRARSHKDDDTAGAAPDEKTQKKKRKRKPPAVPWKKPKDMPRRPLSAYNIFFKHEREVIMAQRAAAAGGADKPSIPQDSSPQSSTKSKKHVKSGVGFAGLAKSIAAKWKEMDAESREPFEKSAAGEKAKYKEKMLIWRAKQKAEKEAQQTLEQQPSSLATELGNSKKGAEVASNFHQMQAMLETPPTQRKMTNSMETLNFPQSAHNNTPGAGNDLYEPFNLHHLSQNNPFPLPPSSGMSSSHTQWTADQSSSFGTQLQDGVGVPSTNQVDSSGHNSLIQALNNNQGSGYPEHWFQVNGSPPTSQNTNSIMNQALGVLREPSQAPPPPPSNQPDFSRSTSAPVPQNHIGQQQGSSDPGQVRRSNFWGNSDVTPTPIEAPNSDPRGNRRTSTSATMQEQLHHSNHETTTSHQQQHSISLIGSLRRSLDSEAVDFLTNLPFSSSSSEADSFNEFNDSFSSIKIG